MIRKIIFIMLACITILATLFTGCENMDKSKTSSDDIYFLKAHFSQQ